MRGFIKGSISVMLNKEDVENLSKKKVIMKKIGDYEVLIFDEEHYAIVEKQMLQEIEERKAKGQCKKRKVDVITTRMEK